MIDVYGHPCVCVAHIHTPRRLRRDLNHPPLPPHKINRQDYYGGGQQRGAAAAGGYAGYGYGGGRETPTQGGYGG